MFVVAVLENFGYRQINSCWRFVGTMRWLFSRRRRHSWGHVSRDGSWQQNAAGAEPASQPHAPEGSHLP
jgi:hypothetical protein